MNLTGLAKRAAKRVLMSTGAMPGLARLAPASAAILMYHSVQHDPRSVSHSIGDGITHSAAVFESQMELLGREFSPVTIEEICLFLEGRGRLPRRAVAVTFDDGFCDNYQIAAPILAKYGLRAAFYVTVGCVDTGRAPWFCRLRRAFCTTVVPHWHDFAAGRIWDLSDAGQRVEARKSAMRQCAVLAGSRQGELLERIEQSLGVEADGRCEGLMLQWSQLAAMRRAGHVIGSHSMTHPNLTRIGLLEARRELCESKRLLEDRLGEPVTHFSYPCAILPPHWNDHTEALTRELGYRCAATSIPGVARGAQNPHQVPRIAAPLELEEFRWALEASFVGLRV